MTESGEILQIGTGFKDDDLQEHTKFFKDHVIENSRNYYRSDNAVEPDQWFDAIQVHFTCFFGVPLAHWILDLVVPSLHVIYSL